MKKDDCAFTRATFVSELKNRFRCCVKIHDEETMCYVPSSCKLSNFVDLSGMRGSPFAYNWQVGDSV